MGFYKERDPEVVEKLQEAGERVQFYEHVDLHQWLSRLRDRLCTEPVPAQDRDNVSASISKRPDIGSLAPVSPTTIAQGEDKRTIVLLVNIILKHEQYEIDEASVKEAIGEPNAVCLLYEKKLDTRLASVSEWQEVARDLDQLVTHARSIARSGCYVVAGRAPLPVFSYLGQRMVKMWPISVMARWSDGRWERIELSDGSSSSDSSALSVGGAEYHDNAGVRGVLAIMCAQQYAFTESMLDSFCKQVPGALAWSYVITAGGRSPGLKPFGREDLSSLLAHIRDGVAVLAQQTSIRSVVVPIAGPSWVAFWVGYSLNPNVLGRLEFPIYTMGHGYSPALAVPMYKKSEVLEEPQPRIKQIQQRSGAESPLTVADETTLLKSSSRVEAAADSAREAEPTPSEAPSQVVKKGQHEASWLHISDLHLKGGDPYDSDLVLGGVVELVESGRLPSRPDFIVVTGDVAFSGNAREYERATRFFDDLRTAAGVGRERLVVVPGNHDVDRRSTRGLARTIADESESQEYFGPDHPRHHFGAQSAFRRWHDAYFGHGRNLPEDSTCGPVVVMSIRETFIAILPINTTLFACGDDDHGKLWVGRRPLREAAKGIRNVQADLRIAAMHHPVEWLSHVERAHIRRILRESVDLVLTGHLHEPDAVRVLGSGGEVIQVAAGATYQGSQYPCKLFHGALHGRTIRMRSYVYLDDLERWGPDVTVFANEPGFEGTFQLPVREQGKSSTQWVVSKGRSEAIGVEGAEDVVPVISAGSARSESVPPLSHEVLDEELRDEIAKDILANLESTPGLSERLGRGSKNWEAAAAESDKALVQAILATRSPDELVDAVEEAMVQLIARNDSQASKMAKGMLIVLVHGLPVVTGARPVVGQGGAKCWTTNAKYPHTVELRMALFDGRPLELWDIASNEVSDELPTPRAHVDIRRMPRSGAKVDGKLVDTITMIEAQLDELNLGRMADAAVLATRLDVQEFSSEDLKDRIEIANMAMREARSDKDPTKHLTLYTIANIKDGHTDEHPFIRRLTEELGELVVLIPSLCKEDERLDWKLVIKLKKLHNTYCKIQKGHP